MAKLFLMRWNPAISSYKLEVYHRNCKDFPDGFSIDWSVWNYSEANNGDYFVMMRVGEYKPGIVFYGTFVSDPYVDEDWAGTDKKRYYVLMNCFGYLVNDQPIISADEIQKRIPDLNWMHGHSGEVLSNDIAEQVVFILKEHIPDFSFNPDTMSCENEYFDAADKLPELMEKFAALSPSVHSRDEEDYDWLESEEAWSRCLLIPNSNQNGPDIEVETYGEFILYFAGSHAHYENDYDGYKALQEEISDIISGKVCAYSCMYDDWAWCRGFALIMPTKEKVKDFVRGDDEYFVRMLAEYTEKDVREDGVLTIELHYFDSQLNKTFRFRLDELSEKVEEYKKRQLKVREQYGD